MAFGRESGPGTGQPAEWKMPEKKPFNPAMMEETMRDIPRESAETYQDLPPPPIGDDDIPTFLGKTLENEQAARAEIPNVSESEIDALVSNIQEAAPKTPTRARDMFAETLPSARIERATDYQNVPPPVETQPPENLQMRGEKLIIDGTEYNVPPVLDEAAQAIMENPELLDFEATANNPDELARFFPGLDAPARKQVADMFHVREKLLKVQLELATTPEMKSNVMSWNKKNLVESIKEEQVRTQDRKKKRAA